MTNTDFVRRRQQELAAERKARREALERGEMVLDPPGPDDGPEVVAVVETRVEGMPGAPRWVRDARVEAVRILTDGVLTMSGSGLRVEGEPAGDVQRPETPHRAPEPARPRPKSSKAHRKPKKAAQGRVRRPKVPKVRPAPKPRPERPALPDELRCAGVNKKGERCRLEAIADGRCRLHSVAG
jgi:hypothetical protein